MALTKSQILVQVNSLLASAQVGGITAANHRSTMSDLIDKVYDETIDGVSFTGTELTFTRDGGTGTPIVVDVQMTATDVVFTPTGNTTAPNVQLALQEIQTDLDGLRADTPTQLSDLDDVDATVSTPSDGDILVYRTGSDFVLEAKPAAGSNPAAADITDATADGIALITSADANPFTDADEAKLDAIEDNATADQTAAEVPIVDGGGYYLGADVETALQEAGSKLSGIAAGADVTDTANVTAAGALMDSEVTNLAQVKAFDSSDYATAAQGALADSAQQPPSEGAFVNGDKTKLDGIAAGAEVNTIESVTSGEPTGSDQVLNVVSLTQAEYDAGSPNATTFYIIT